MHNEEIDKKLLILPSSTDKKLPYSTKRYGDYFPSSAEVCPRCHCAAYQTIKDANGRDMRDCSSCHLHYLPSTERCPHCTSSDYDLVHDANGQEMRKCKSCHLNYYPDLVQ
jgi:Zn-finger protein